MLFSSRLLPSVKLMFYASVLLTLFSVSAYAQPLTFQFARPQENRPASNVGSNIQTAVTVQTTAASQTRIVTTLASKARGAVLDRPQGITTDGIFLYVTDPINNTISKIAIATGVVTLVAGSRSTQAWGYQDGPGEIANFKRPYGITTDGKNLYVADTFNHVIRKIVIATGVVSTLAGRWNTAGSVGSEDGVGPDASFSSPRGITTDGTFLYVCDTGNQTIRKISLATGQVTTLAGKPGVIGSADGVGPLASFDSLTGITTDGTNVYVADVKNNSIRKVVIATGAVSTFAGQAGTSGTEDGIGTRARFTGPHGLVTDGPNLYVADSFSHTIRRVVLATGVVTTIAGVPGINGDTDGLGRNATFSRPGNITSDGTYLYVTDTHNSAVRIIE